MSGGPSLAPGSLASRDVLGVAATSAGVCRTDGGVERGSATDAFSEASLTVSCIDVDGSMTAGTSASKRASGRVGREPGKLSTSDGPATARCTSATGPAGGEEGTD